MSRTCLENATGQPSRGQLDLRRERRANDEEELPQSEQRVYRQLVGKLLWIDRADMRCAMRKASSSLRRTSDMYMKNVDAILRYLRDKPWSDYS